MRACARTSRWTVAWRVAAAGLLAALVIAGMNVGGRAAPAPAGMRVPLDADPATLDPVLVNDLPSSVVVSHLYATLVEVNAAGALVGDAAESWTTSPDGRIYRFVLREDLRFHTGRRVTAYDVKLSFERAVNP
ncbi:MAG: ABC transporter substrate-binding protein, partial [Armatimonadota bacterium]